MLLHRFETSHPELQITAGCGRNKWYFLPHPDRKYISIYRQSWVYIILFIGPLGFWPLQIVYLALWGKKINANSSEVLWMSTVMMTAGIIYVCIYLTLQMLFSVPAESPQHRHSWAYNITYAIYVYVLFSLLFLCGSRAEHIFKKMCLYQLLTVDLCKKNGWPRW